MTKICAAWIFTAIITSLIIGVLLDPGIPTGLITNGVYKVL